MPLSLDARQLKNFFEKSKLCESLTLGEVEILRQYIDEKDYKPGEIVAPVDSVSHELFFIIEGELDLYHHDAIGQDTEVGKMEAGTLAGEISFFDNRPRTIGMKAGRKGAKVLALSRPMYERLKYEHPPIAVNLLENAIVSLDELIRHMGDDMTLLNNYMYSVGRQ